MVTSGHRTFCAKVEIIEALLESLRPQLCDLKTVDLLNFKEVYQENEWFEVFGFECLYTPVCIFITTQAIVL